MPVSRKGLSTVSFPKHRKDDRKIVTVWTEVTGFRSKSCYLKAFGAACLSASSLPGTVLLQHYQDNANELGILKPQVGFGNFKLTLFGRDAYR